jgi:hypothetical protein
MSETLSERRMAENEVVFRGYNEQVQKGFDKLKQLAKEDGQEKLLHTDDISLQFYCECSDENCRKRVKLPPNRYNEIHERRDHFVIIPGHEMKSIEHVIARQKDFWIVEKFVTPPETVVGLHTTR